MKANTSLAVILLTLVTIVLAISTSFSVAGPMDALTAGVVIEKMRDAISTEIDHLKNQGSVLEIETYQKLLWLLKDIETSYEKELDKTFQELDKKVGGNLQVIRSIVLEAEQKTKADLDTALGRAQLIVNSAPLSNKYPQLLSVTPTVLSSQKSQISLVALGNFPEIGDPSLKPYVSFNGKKFMPTRATVGNVDFEPMQVDFPEAESVSSPAHFLPAELTFLSRTGFWGFFGIKSKAVYPLTFLYVPPSPGTITLEREVTPTTVVTQNRVWPTSVQPLRQDSNSGDHLNVPWCVPAELYQGWSIVSNSVALAVEWQNGDVTIEHSGQPLSITPPCFEITTRQHHKVGPFGNGTPDGALTFRINYQVTQTSTQQSFWEPEKVNLNWSDSRSFSVVSGKWRVKLDAFDRTHQEFSGAKQTHYLNVIVNSSSSITIEAPRTQNLVAP